MLWQCGKRQIEYGHRVLVMGIVNVTPDSFSDGGQFNTPEKTVDYALQLVKDGADILDIGAQSTRPGYIEITPEEEWKRLQPVITLLRKKTDVPLSADTYFPLVAEKALTAGADIINDVSGTLQPSMASLIASCGAGWVIMHNGDGGVAEVKAFFEKAAEQAVSYGIRPEQLCFDMGIGFGKSREQDIALLANAEKYHISGFPLLLGTSRKRVIGTISGEAEPARRLCGNIAADCAAICGGVDILRIHDVKKEIQGIRAAEALLSARKNYG